MIFRMDSCSDDALYSILDGETICLQDTYPDFTARIINSSKIAGPQADIAIVFGNLYLTFWLNNLGSVTHPSKDNHASNC